MAKTPEELNALKEKVKALKNELGTLSEDELKQIAGGDETTDCQKVTCPRCGSSKVYFDCTLGTYICKSCGHVWI